MSLACLCACPSGIGRVVALSLLVFAPVRSVPAQVEWQQVSLLSNRRDPSMVYHAGRQRIMCVVQPQYTFISPFTMELWDWDGGGWTQLPSSPNAPVLNGEYGVTYDAARQRIVLLTDDYYGQEIWEWDGNVWLKSAATGPSGRNGFAITYDAVRQRVVLFGGRLPSFFYSWLDDTWEWDGTRWTRHNPAVRPSPRQHHRMVFDAARGRTVLFGGDTTSGPVNDTWEWDGVSWLRRSPVTSPPARAQHGMTYDTARGRVVVFSGKGRTGLLRDTWEWDGTNWTQSLPAWSPEERYSPAMGYDEARQRSVLFGGFTLFRPTFHNRTWEWDGGTWSTSAPTLPPARGWGAMTFDSGRNVMVLFGGNNTFKRRSDTWEWSDGKWVERFTDNEPTPRNEHAMVYDQARGRIVLFGGKDPAVQSDTWEYDGINWYLRSPATSPPPQAKHVMAYHVPSQLTMMFTEQGETWVWDGTDWTQRFPAGAVPIGRTNAAMAYDSTGKRTVLWGGEDAGGQPLSDTWVWDGSSWMAGPSGPLNGPGEPVSLVDDTARGRLVLHTRQEMWELEGQTWYRRMIASPTITMDRCAIAYHPVAARVFLLQDVLGDMWGYAPTLPATYTAFGAGCAGTVGVPQLATSGGQLPWIGASVTLELDNLPPGQLAFLFFGRSNSAWGSTTLPFNLGPFGMAGCQLLVSPDLAVGLPNAGGTATLPLSLAGISLGAQFHNQGGVIDPGANALGIVWSNGATAVVGGR